MTIRVDGPVALADFILVSRVTGSAGDDVLVGTDAPDLLDGLAGADTMRGGFGNDVYLVDNAGDSVEENAGEGTDEVRTALASFSVAPDRMSRT
jgi:Ca2+-binding RTX toxin-like protein